LQWEVILAELKTLSWLAIIRLGLIQTSLGALIFLPTNTLNRIMVVEYALAASVPGFLITLHHVVQLARPYIGYGSDAGGRRTPWIIGGMIILAIGSVTAAYGATLANELGWVGTRSCRLGLSAYRRGIRCRRHLTACPAIKASQ
jgi:BCD family chlorophyll transporter-like MFS transporter